VSDFTPAPVARAALGLVAAIALIGATLMPAGVSAQDDVPRIDSARSMEALEFLTGSWKAPADDPALEQSPELAELIVLQIEWTVGKNALRLREYVRGEGPMNAALDGFIYWDPAQERIEFVAVGGHGPDQGRLFVGEFRPLADGRVERVYDVFYRTAADMPGGELGGLRRQYREIYSADGPDGLTHTLEWWLDRRWQPFSRGEYRLARDGSG